MDVSETDMGHLGEGSGGPGAKLRVWGQQVSGGEVCARQREQRVLVHRGRQERGSLGNCKQLRVAHVSHCRWGAGRPNTLIHNVWKGSLQVFNILFTLHFH